MNRAVAVYGIAGTLAQAERIVSELRSAGFGYDRISVLLPDQGATRDFAHSKGTKAPEGAVAGAGTGGVLGGTLGLLAGIGSLALPGVGPLIAAGPIMAALSGAALGATFGGIAGTLIGMGIPEYEAKQYEGKLRDGNILISIHTDDSDEEDLAEEILEKENASDVASAGEASPPEA